MALVSLNESTAAPTTSTGSDSSTRRSTSRPVDYSVRRPDVFNARYGHVLDYMARVELEVDRNVLELTTLLPDPPEIDRRFYAEVWQPQEIRHGLILDELQVQLGRPAAEPDLTSIGVEDEDPRRARAPRRLPGRLPDALLPDRHGDRALRGARLQPAPRRRRRDGRERRRADGDRADPPPGARATTPSTSCPRAACGPQLAAWQRWMVRRMRSFSFAPVGANNADAEGRLRRHAGDPAHRPGRRRASPARSPASSASCSGPTSAASRSRRTSPRRSARRSSWRGAAGGLTTGCPGILTRRRCNAPSEAVRPGAPGRPARRCRRRSRRAGRSAA